MKLSTKMRYGLRAMIDISLHSEGNPVLVQSIAERQKVSKKYLENLLSSLKGASLVRSVRGAKGGYLLARDPETIKIEEILVALEGPIELADCVDDPEGCSRADICCTHEFWIEMTERIQSLLRGTTLADLAKKAREKKKIDSFVYTI